MAIRRKNSIKYTLKPYANVEEEFIKVPKDILILTDEKEFKTYCFLCDKWNKEQNYTSVSLNTIVKNTNVSLSSVKRAINGLKEKKLIRVFNHNNYSNNCYSIYTPTIIETIIENENTEFELVKITPTNENNKYIKDNEINKNNNNRKKTYKDKKWRENILERDNYTCQLCGKTDCELDVHHIKRYVDYEELRNDMNNGITLCKKCHYKVTGHEKEYEDIFFNILLNRIGILNKDKDNDNS